MGALMASVRLIPAILPHGHKNAPARSSSPSPKGWGMPRSALSTLACRCWQNFKRIAFISILIAAVNEPVLFAAHAATAQSIPVSQPAVQKMPAYCQRSTLTSAQFMQSIRAIISHGDLTDIPFIEKTLGTKFTVSQGWKPDGSSDPQKFIYQSSEALGSPIQVVVVVNPPTAIRTGRDEISRMRIESPSFPESDPVPNFVENCLHISSTDFFSDFGTAFQPLGINGASPIAPGVKIQGSVAQQDRQSSFITGYSQTQGSLGRNTSRLFLTFGCSQASNYGPGRIVDEILITQDR
jgi:hypothetical protein